MGLRPNQHRLLQSRQNVSEIRLASESRSTNLRRQRLVRGRSNPSPRIRGRQDIRAEATIRRRSRLGQHNKFLLRLSLERQARPTNPHTLGAQNA